MRPSSVVAEKSGAILWISSGCSLSRSRLDSSTPARQVVNIVRTPSTIITKIAFGEREGLSDAGSSAANVFIEESETRSEPASSQIGQNLASGLSPKMAVILHHVASTNHYLVSVVTSGSPECSVPCHPGRPTRCNSPRCVRPRQSGMYLAYSKFHMPLLWHRRQGRSDTEYRRP